VTVLFADITGSTALSEQLGEEGLFAVMDELYELFIHEVHRYEGTVNELTGDGIVAFFGAPLAVEQAPQRAVRSALAIQREVSRFSAGFEREKSQRLQVRVGINTGPVIVGTVGNNLRMDYKAVGDTVILAARMEQTAAPGTIQITERTYKLVEGYFQCEDLGLVSVKGKAAKVQVYRVTGERGARSRLDVERERGFTRFVGRERELELLGASVERVTSGRGQAISIVGEAGLGKSRLLDEFHQAFASEDLTWLEGRCSPYGAVIAYLPIVEFLKQSFSIDANDSDTDITRKVEGGLRRLGTDLATTAPYLLHLGREFPWELVKAGAGLPEDELLAPMAALTDAELIYERGLPPHTTYLFKHALIQEVAYDSLLLATRRQLHQQIGEIILAQHRDNLEEWMGILAYHFTHSGDPARALPYLVQTGERAWRVCANAEALHAFTQAMEILDTLPPTEATRRQRVELTMRLTSLHTLLGGDAYWERESPL